MGNKLNGCSIESWYLYIVETKLGHWYTGITTDVKRRVAQHESGKGAKNLRGKGPLKLLFEYPVADKSTAAKLEWQVKQLTRVQKERFVASKGATANDAIKSLMVLTASS
ncbi:GIY-YIG nuclease family protein [Pseudoalteromonas sp. T1lg65]|uniref:GIY-YIG nuclease family protein n=1 Tax=Pseudoalteromonas sp. T1lg65 TaxID=2077101 RepID=UPI003F7AFFF4